MTTRLTFEADARDHGIGLATYLRNIATDRATLVRKGKDSRRFAARCGTKANNEHDQGIAVILSQVDYERLTISDGTSMIDFFAISALSQLEITERDRNDIGIDGDF